MFFLFKIDRPLPRPSYWYTVGNHFPVFLVAGAVLAASFLIPADSIPVSPCFFKHWTGYPCPTCGFTRAFCDLARGHGLNAVAACPFALIVFVFTFFLFVYNALALFAGIFGIRVQSGILCQLTPRRLSILISVLTALLLANWIYRLMLGLK